MDFIHQSCPVKTSEDVSVLRFSTAEGSSRTLACFFAGSRVDEVAPVGTPVGELSVEDEDQGQTHSFQLLDDAAGLFKMGDDNTVVKATDERLDVQKVYSIRIKATDNGSAPAEVGLKPWGLLWLLHSVLLCCSCCYTLCCYVVVVVTLCVVML